ncbi:NAD-dependent epimerase/dehydratase family protein [Aliarcobacter cryaerophilus]|uniref:NAD-dependent epimerase/dehydratase family protein n=1 Tax=Aliarcobacter cryaerophilus TaxID=28198 RepID=UPI000835D9FE|nr:SDR family oxidoreductase [Aliarcobacter cryaerophilus]
MKNILITGGTGYVGTLLTETLLKEGHKITVVDTMWFGNYLEEHKNLTLIKTDILDIDSIPMEGIDTIFHLANIANDPTGDLNSKLTWEVNVLASKLLVEKAIKSGVKQFIYASSGSVYGVKEEDQVTEDLDLIPISDYNKTKMISERVFLSYKDQINTVIIRPATVCGYSKRMRLDVSVNMLTMQALTNKRITVFGGKQTRPNIHIQDMVNVYLHFLENNTLTGIYNAGFENISILDIAQKVANTISAEIIISESNDPRSYRLNSDKLLLTGFKPQFTVQTAIDEITENYNKGILKDEDKYYNLKVMKELGL